MDQTPAHGKNTPREKTTSERQFRIKQAGFGARLRRDVFVFRYLTRIIWMWLTVGGRIRRRHREAAKAGEIYYIDDIMGGGNV
jgi:hypothetical protein